MSTLDGILIGELSGELISYAGYPVRPWASMLWADGHQMLCYSVQSMDFISLKRL